MALDQIRLHFNPQSLLILNLVLALIMFGVALDLKLADFRRVFEQPRAMGVGLLAQLGLLPAATWLLVWLWSPPPSIALGMFLVAACPGGNVSNFITHIAKGNTSLSVSMTAVVSCVAFITTPWNFGFWAGLWPESAQLLRSVHVDIVQILQTMALLLLLPLFVGVFLSEKFPILAERLRQPLRIFSLVAFLAFIVIALLNNWQNFLKAIEFLFVIVALHNAIAFLTGYLTARAFRLNIPDRRAITVEVGIQNSGLGLVLIFTFFDGMGGMAIIAAWWGVWHLIAGLALARFWSQAPT